MQGNSSLIKNRSPVAKCSGAFFIAALKAQEFF